jgi:hypothetical protein
MLIILFAGQCESCPASSLPTQHHASFLSTALVSPHSDACNGVNSIPCDDNIYTTSVTKRLIQFSPAVRKQHALKEFCYYFSPRTKEITHRSFLLSSCERESHLNFRATVLNQQQLPPQSHERLPRKVLDQGYNPRAISKPKSCLST